MFKLLCSPVNLEDYKAQMFVIRGGLFFKLLRIYYRCIPFNYPGRFSMSKVVNSQKCADALIAWVREYAAVRIDSRLADERRAFPPHIFLDLGNQGFFGMHITRDHGGLGLTTYDMLRAQAL